MAKIIITRKKSGIGSVQSHDVYLVNKYVGTLKNGGTLEFDSDVGVHMISFRATKKYGKNSTFSVVVNEPTETVDLSAKFDSQGQLVVKYADNAPHIPNSNLQQGVNQSQQQATNGGVCCPKCYSNNLQIISDVKGKGVSATNLCLCGLLGLAGAGKTKTTHYWVCQNCGNKFKV